MAALWWGSLTTIGFLVVPLLFRYLPTPAIAGNMASHLFEVQTWVSCGCGLFLLLQSRSVSGSAQRPVLIKQETVVVILTGVLLAFLSEYSVAPRIVARENLRLWHSVGSVMYLLQWLCAAVTCWLLMPPRPNGQV
jgi:hypothetical protein